MTKDTQGLGAGALTPKGEAIKIAVANGCDEYSFSEGWNAAMNTRASTTQPDSRDGLLPCPFCGAKDLDFHPSNYPGEWKVQCNYNEGGCGAASCYAESKELAAKAWNTRAAISQPKEGADRKLPVVRLDCHAPKLPDECEVDLFLDEETIKRMRPVKGGFIVKILALNPPESESQKP